ncbi:uncharacterized protein V6R79_003301 [Siganus canaliculatus]
MDESLHHIIHTFEIPADRLPRLIRCFDNAVPSKNKQFHWLTEQFCRWNSANEKVDRDIFCFDLFFFHLEGRWKLSFHAIITHEINFYLHLLLNNMNCVINMVVKEGKGRNELQEWISPNWISLCLSRQPSVTKQVDVPLTADRRQAAKETLSEPSKCLSRYTSAEVVPGKHLLTSVSLLREPMSPAAKGALLIGMERLYGNSRGKGAGKYSQLRWMQRLDIFLVTDDGQKLILVLRNAFLSARTTDAHPNMAKGSDRYFTVFHYCRKSRHYELAQKCNVTDLNRKIMRGKKTKGPQLCDGTRPRHFLWELLGCAYTATYLLMFDVTRPNQVLLLTNSRPNRTQLPPHLIGARMCNGMKDIIKYNCGNKPLFQSFFNSFW